MITGPRWIGAIDLPGHRWTPTATNVTNWFWASAERIAHEAGPADYIGYSMGGRVALHVALAHPQVVDRLVLIGATAGIEDAVERERRQDSDTALAQRIMTVGVAGFLEEWLAQPLFRTLSASAACIDQRLENTAEGLAWSLTNMGTGVMEPLWTKVSAIGCPVLVIAGGEDPKFRALGERLVASIGDNAELAVVEDAGHSVHLEAPVQTAEVISEFLDRTAL